MQNTSGWMKNCIQNKTTGVSWSLVFFVLLFFSFLALFYHVLIQGVYLRQGWPTGALGEMPEILANDLTRLMGISANLSPYIDIRSFSPYEAVPYPPFAFVIHAALAKLGMLGGAIVFYTVLISGALALAWQEFKNLPLWQRATGCLAFTIGCYPFLYVLDRANFDVIAFLLVGAALLIERSKNQKLPSWLAPFLIGIAGALKIYPLFFVLIYLARREWKAIVISVFTTIVISLLASFLLAGNLADQVAGFLHELKITNICYQHLDSCKNLSFIYPIKCVLKFLFNARAEKVWLISASYTIASIGLITLVAALIYFRRATLALAVVLITVMGIWIPVMSFNYKLLFVLLPVFLLFDERRPNFSLIGVLLLFTLIPKRILGYNWEININQMLLLMGFVISALILWEKPAKFLAAYEAVVTKIICAILLIGFTLPYPYLTARAFAVPEGGTIVLPMSKHSPRSAFGSGWGPFESDAHNTWRWTSGCEAAINLRVNANHDYTLKIYAGNHARNGKQMVNILFNNMSLGTQSLAPAENKELTFTIPAAAIPLTKIVPDRLVLRPLVCNPPDEQTPTRLGISVSRIMVIPLN
jgi:hypothetical protein